MTFASTTFVQTDFTLELPTNYTGTLVETSTSLMIENLVDPPPHMEEADFSGGAHLTAPELMDTTISTPNNLTVSPTPEPGSVALLAFGASALIGRRRRRSV
jgi:hypothetical protein